MNTRTTLTFGIALGILFASPAALAQKKEEGDKAVDEIKKKIDEEDKGKGKPEEAKSKPGPKEGKKNPFDVLKEDSGKEKRNDEIARNQEKALDNYRDIIASQQTAKLNTLQRRLEENQKLMASQEAKLKEASRALRLARLKHLRELNTLKSSRTAGRISPKAYEAKVKDLDDTFIYKIEKELKPDVVFYTKEVETTRKRIKDLTEQYRIERLALSKLVDLKKVARQKTRVEKLLMRLRKGARFTSLDPFRVRHCEHCRRH